jgi:DNA segregation ATPase FtsK/SpoIIIE, S-DNA-T family
MPSTPAMGASQRLAVPLPTRPAPASSASDYPVQEPAAVTAPAPAFAEPSASPVEQPPWESTIVAQAEPVEAAEPPPTRVAPRATTLEDTPDTTMGLPDQAVGTPLQAGAGQARRARAAVNPSAQAMASAVPADYKLPPVELLNAVGITTVSDPREVEAKKHILQETLESFGIDATVGDATCGPRVTLFEIKPAPGVKVERISSLANNIAMNLKAESLRILTPIPGKDSVGIEVPNQVSAMVQLRELLESLYFKGSRAAIPIALGKNIQGQPVIMDLNRAPHLLIAGATGSGKSVCMNTLILSLLFRFRPDQLKLIMVDPKKVEFSGYNSLPHLITPVVTDNKKVPIALRWAINQMEWRYEILSRVGVRDIDGFNSRKKGEPVLDAAGNPIPDKLPYIVIIIDELADIMMTSKAEVETSLARIAQLARAVGMHAVIATQRPSVNIITGVIKANFPTRIAFQVSSVVDSRTILDGKGAESLLGRGDMLFKPPGGSRLERTQGALISDEEIAKVVQFVSAQAQPQFVDDIFATIPEGEEESDSDDEAPRASSRGARPSFSANQGSQDDNLSTSDDEGDDDESLIKRAIEVLLRDRRATTSHLQRRLRIGYNKASLIIEELERRGIVGPQIGQNPREILITGENLKTAPATAGEE